MIVVLVVVIVVIIIITHYNDCSGYDINNYDNDK